MGTYGHFPLSEQSVPQFKEFAVSLGCPEPTWKPHVTSIYSKIDVVPPNYWKLGQWAAQAESLGFFKSKFGLTLVLFLEFGAATESWTRARAIGATWDYPTYTPHLTLAYNVEDVTKIRFRVPNTPWIFSGMVVEPLNEERQPKAPEAEAAPKEAK